MPELTSFYSGVVTRLCNFVATLATTQKTLLTYCAVFCIGTALTYVFCCFINRLKGI